MVAKVWASGSDWVGLGSSSWKDTMRRGRERTVEVDLLLVVVVVVLEPGEKASTKLLELIPVTEWMFRRASSIPG